VNDQVALFTSEVTRMASEVSTEGKLGDQAGDNEADVGTWMRPVLPRMPRCPRLGQDSRKE